MLITQEELHLCIPHATDRAIETYITPLNLAMEEYGINTPLRIAHFIAQIAHESGSLRYVSEIADGSAYDNRTDLGNTTKEAIEVARRANTTPGRLYRGHGLIQITGYFNHKICGENLSLDLVNKPFLLTVPEFAALSAAWYWDWRNCNEPADKDDARKVTRIINGGTRGLTQRIQYTERNKKILTLH